MSKVYLEQIEKTEQLLEGLKNNINLVKDKGLDKDFIRKLEADKDQAIIYNSENDKLRAELKAKAHRANQKLEEIKAQVKEAKRVIKQDFPQERWQYFGISDKR